MNEDRPYRALLPFIVLFAMIDAIACIRLHWRFSADSVAVIAGFVVIFSFPLFVPRYRHDRKINGICSCVVAFLCFSHTSTVCSYVVVATNAPLVDDALAHVDSMLGFQWLDLWRWQMHHGNVNRVLFDAYGSPALQAFVAIVYLASSKQEKALTEFFRVVGISLTLTLIVSGCFPAAGAAKYFHQGNLINLSPWSDFEILRAGQPMSLNLLRMQGLVSFPSFHTIMAIALAYAMRRSRAFPLFVVINVAVLASTPVGGGHYLVDVLGGIATVALSIRLAGIWNDVESMRPSGMNA